MNRILLLVSIILSVFKIDIDAKETNELLIPDVTGMAGSSISIPLELKNVNPEITSLQFVLDIPSEALNLKTDELAFTDRAADHKIGISSKGNGRYMVVVFSPTNSVFSSNSGAILNLNCYVKESASPDKIYEIKLEDVILCDRAGENVLTGVTCGTFLVSPSADFKPDVPTCSKSEINPGDEFEVSYVVNNFGKADSGKWSEQLFLENNNGERKYIGTFVPDVPGIPMNGKEYRVVSVTLPKLVTIDGKVNLIVKIVPDSEDSERMTYRSNNEVSTTGFPLTIGKNLILDIPTDTMEESTDTPIKCKLTRSGSRVESETFGLHVDIDDARLLIPESVTIPQGQSAVYFIVKVIDNENIDNNDRFKLSVEGNGYGEQSAIIKLIDDELPELTLSAETDELTEGESLRLTLERNYKWDVKTDVRLECDMPAKFSYPEFISFEAGEKTKSILIESIDNDDIELDAIVSFSASAEGFEKDMFAFTLHDNDVPQLEFSITPEVVAEDAGPMAIMAKLRRCSGVSSRVKVILSDNSGKDIYYPQKSVVFEKGMTEIEFPIGINDNDIVDGIRKVALNASVQVASCNCSVSAGSSGSVTADLEIMDNDGPSLMLTTSKTMLLEGDSNGVELTVTRNTPVEDELKINLGSNCDDRLDYEKTLIIPAGEKSTRFNVYAKPNSAEEDDMTVSFKACAENHSNGVCWLMISDRTLPDLAIRSFSISEAEIPKGGSVRLHMDVVNEGPVTLPEAVRLDVYCGKEIIQSVYTSGQLIPDAHESIESYVTLDSKVGCYQMYVVANTDRKVRELTYRNNQSEFIDVKVKSPFTAVIKADKSVYNHDDEIVLNGMIHGCEILKQPVEIFVINNGIRRAFTVDTDDEGSFSMQFKPYAMQYGTFTVGACYPGENSDEITDSFGIYGLERASNETLKFDIYASEPFCGKVRIKNAGDLNLSGVKATAVDVPDGMDVKLSCHDKLDGNSESDLEFVIKAMRETEGMLYEGVGVRVETSEGASLQFHVYFYCLSHEGKLVCDKSKISTKMIKGITRSYPIILTNNGDGETGVVTMSAPAWITMDQKEIPSISPGKSVQFSLNLTPETSFQINSVFEGTIAFNCENGKGMAIPYSIETVSETKGTLVVDVTDEFTYYTTEAPHVSGAQVLVRHPATGAFVAEGTTREDGIFSVVIPEGYYSLNVTAEKHKGYSGYIFVEPGESVTYVDIPLAYSASSFSFDVEEYEEGDGYDIRIVPEFETNVPVPVVVIEGPDSVEGDEMADGESKLLEFTLTNHGLITAFNNQFILPDESEEWSWNQLDFTEPFDIPAKASVIIPVVVTRHLAHPGNTPQKIASNPGDAFLACMSMMKDRYEHMCGDDMKNNESAKKLAMKFCADGAIAGAFLDAFGNIGSGSGSGGGGVPSRGGKDIVGSEEKDPVAYNMDRTLCNPCWADFADKNYDRATNWAFGPLGKYINKARNTAYSMTQGSGADSKTISNRHDIKKLIFDYGKKFLLDMIPDGKGKDAVSEGIDIVGDYGDYEECLKALKSKSQENMITGLPAKARRPESWVTEFVRYAQMYGEQVSHYMNAMVELTGDSVWVFNDDPTIHEFFEKFVEMDEWTIEECAKIKPASVSFEQLSAFVNRMADTFEDGREGGCDFNKIAEELIATAVADDFANENGFESMSEFIEAEHREFAVRMNEQSQSVCASISIAFDQSLTMTRQAFKGYLTVFNGDSEAPMENFIFTPIVQNTRTGERVSSREMQMDIIDLDTFIGEASLESPWILNPEKTGKATVRFIPSVYAAAETPTEYSFGGTITYVDPLTGLQITEKLMPVLKTVNPSPLIDLTYFLQRDIYGDDPLTDYVEESEPAEMALIIHNKGYGEVGNLRLMTQQPVIINNEKGLEIDFSIISSQLDGKEKVLSLGDSMPMDFGTIPASETSMAQWWLQSSLLGHFTDYSVEYNNVSDFDNPNLSLLNQVSVHEITRGFTVDGNISPAVRGFLANDIEDSEDCPDAVYFSDCRETEDLYKSGLSVFDKKEASCKVKFTPSASGWNYGHVLNGIDSSMRLTSIIRESDGMAIPIDNFWLTTVTMIDGKDPKHENLIHGVVYIESPETYELMFEPKIDKLEVISYGMINDYDNGIQYVREVELIFNKPVDYSTFDSDDVVLYYNGIRFDGSDLYVYKNGSDKYVIDLGENCKNAGSYELRILLGGIADDDGVYGDSYQNFSWVQEKRVESNVNSLDSEFGIRVFPIPLRDMLTIETDSNSISQVEAYSQTGIARSYRASGQSSLTINADDWEAGVYLLRVVTDNGVYVKKVLKID